MILGGQRSLLGISKLHEQDLFFVQQTQNLLNNFLEDEAEVTYSDLSLVEDLAYALRNTSHGEAKHKAEALLKKILQKIELRQATLNKLKDINFVAFTLNNKKMARALSPEALLVAQKTVNQDQSASLKFKARLTQQLQSFALLQYAEIKSSKQAIDANKEFIDVFNLRHKNVVIQQKNNISKSSSFPDAKPEKRNSFFSFMKKAKDKVLKTLDNVRHNIKVFFYRHEPKIAVASFALLGLLGNKLYKMSDNPSPYPYQNFGINTQKNQTPMADTANISQAKTADFVKEAQKMAVTENKTEESNSLSSSKTQITADYFDTSLEIHLKSKEKVQSLYDKIDALADDGKIKFDNGTNTKKYAHAFTMYNLIRPNSVENQKIQNLLNGGKENPELINRLVLKAKDNGTGVKPDSPSIQTSNFDSANMALQQQHLKNLKSLSL